MDDADATNLELEAVDLSVLLEWAESQGRHADADDLRQRLATVLDALAGLVDNDPVDDPV